MFKYKIVPSPMEAQQMPLTRSHQTSNQEARRRGERESNLRGQKNGLAADASTARPHPHPENGARQGGKRESNPRGQKKSSAADSPPPRPPASTPTPENGARRGGERESNPRQLETFFTGHTPLITHVTKPRASCVKGTRRLLQLLTSRDKTS